MFAALPLVPSEMPRSTSKAEHGRGRGGFLRLVETVRYAIYTVLTDNSIQFTSCERGAHDSQHIPDRVCDEPCTGFADAPSRKLLRDGIEHRPAKVNRFWTNGQAE